MPETTGAATLLVYFHQGGIAMYPLLLCSVVTLAIAIERILVLARAARANAAVEAELAHALVRGQEQSALQDCAAVDSPLGRVMQAVLTPPKATVASREKLLERALTRETGRLERYLPVLATIGSVSPFVGLFGTVLGIMRAFRDIGLAGSAGGAIVAAGIAEALIATATGLIVAVAAVVAFNHLMTWTQAVIANSQLSAEELLAQVE